MTSRLRIQREAAGLTQAELAARAGVSRQLVGAVEAGRHLPRVDGALALATALGVTVESLFEADVVPLDAVSGTVPADGVLVRAGRVGDRIVTAPARVGPDGWDVADGVVEGGALVAFGRAAPGLVVAGCEPGLEVLERLLRERGMGAVAASATSAAARAALAGGRLHAAVVHGPEEDVGRDGDDAGVAYFRLARWQVGLAGPLDAAAGWWRHALAGTVPVVQREPGAAVQRAFERAAAIGAAARAGPRVRSHLEAARRAVLTGTAAVTIEPAARAMDAAFHPIEVHEAQLWVASEWLGERAVAEALDVIMSPRFQRRLHGVGGYDLRECGARVA